MTWLIVDPLLESDFDYKRYMNTLKLNFNPHCIEMLNEVNQVQDMLKWQRARKEKILVESVKTEKQIQEEINEVN